MNLSRAFLAGVIAGIVMSILMALGRAVGIPLAAEMMLGTMFGLPMGAVGTWVFGFVMHLIVSGLIALLYAVGFERVTHRAGWGVGAAFSLVHILIAGIVMAMMPLIHPMIPTPMGAPGFLMFNMGAAAAILFIVEHVIYGALVGGIYAGEVLPTRGERFRREAVV
ncbi:MAG: hypothetical protein ACNA8W_07325 [Bradymonadaceae bacterium]